MAERYAALEDASNGPLGDVAGEAMRKASGLWHGHDLPTLTGEILQAAEALRDAGVFAAIRDGAQPAKEALGRTIDAEALKEIGTAALALRDEWRTVQRLSARLRALETWVESPTAGALADAWARWLEATRDTELTRLGRDLLRILETLSRSGALARLADDLPALIDTVAHLAHMAPALLEAAGPLLNQARMDLAFAHKLADRGRNVAEIWKGPTGEALSRAATELSAWAAEHNVAGLAQEITALLATLRDAGLFPAVREAGLALTGLASSWRRVQAAASADGHAIKDISAAAGETLDRWRHLRAGLADGQGDSPGGIKGLYHLLRDPRVQDGLRQGALLLSGLMGAPPEKTQATHIHGQGRGGAES